jgi:hypothetical protein
VVESLGALRWLTSSTVLREVPEAPVESYQLQAAGHARHSAYRSALDWYSVVHDALEHDEPERLATLLSEGALRPTIEAKRFENSSSAHADGRARTPLAFDTRLGAFAAADRIRSQRDC